MRRFLLNSVCPAPLMLAAGLRWIVKPIAPEPETQP